MSRPAMLRLQCVESDINVGDISQTADQISQLPCNLGAAETFARKPGRKRPAVGGVLERSMCDNLENQIGPGVRQYPDGQVDRCFIARHGCMGVSAWDI